MNNKSIYLDDPYTSVREGTHLEDVTNNVIWGWNRREGLLQRAVFFQANLHKSMKNSCIDPWAFYYLTCCPKDEAHYIFNGLLKYDNDFLNISLTDHSNMHSSIIISGGLSLSSNQHFIDRLITKQPTRSIYKVNRNPNSFDFLSSKYFPTMLYAGSGLSYESGLPTQADVHKWFCVDSENDWTFGLKDELPNLLMQDTPAAFYSFCKLHILADIIPISNSYFYIKHLFDKNIICDILTDNVDDLFSRMNIPYKKTRTTLFPDPYSVTFPDEVKSLLVVGIAADRRNIIAQARECGLPIIVVNPYTEVAPYAQNLSYLQSNDIWLKMCAEKFFTSFIKEGKL